MLPALYGPCQGRQHVWLRSLRWRRRRAHVRGGLILPELVPPERQHKAEPPLHDKTHSYSLAGPPSGSLFLALDPVRVSVPALVAGQEPRGPPRASCRLDSPPARPEKGRSRWTLPISSISATLSHPYHHRSFRCLFTVFVCISCQPFTLSRLTTTLLSQLVLVPTCYGPYPFPPQPRSIQPLESTTCSCLGQPSSTNVQEEFSIYSFNKPLWLLHSFRSNIIST